MTKCKFCDAVHGKLCPQVKAIEYFANGKVKRVEFKTVSDFMFPTVPGAPSPIPAPGTWPWNPLPGPTWTSSRSNVQ